MATSRKRRHSVLVIQESLFLPGRCYPTHPITMGSFCSRSDPKGAEKRSTGVMPPTSSCNCRLAGPVPLRFSALRAGANDERAAVHLASASIRSLPQRDRRLYRTTVWRECTEGGSHYRIRIQPIIRRFIVTKRRADVRWPPDFPRE